MISGIEKADISDFDSILKLYRMAILEHKKAGIVQWDDEYPSAITLKENIIANHTWVIRSDQNIAATVTLDTDQDPQYDAIQWAYPSEKILVIHRLCVNPSLQGNGLAKKIIAFAEAFAYDNSFEVIRLDAFLGNSYSQRLYQNLGYHEAIGYCYYPPDQIMCNCFEKRIVLL